MFKDYDAFDLALALYHWLQHNWNGQSDELYINHCILTEHYRPSRSEEYFNNLDATAKEVYDNLTRDNYMEALAIVLSYKSTD